MSSLAFQTISFFRFGDSTIDAEYDMPQECSDFSFRFLDIGESHSCGPFSRKILLNGQLVDTQIMMGSRIFLSEEKPFMVAIYLYQWNNNISDIANTNNMHRQKPHGIYPFSNVTKLAKQIHCLTNDNNYNYPEFRSIFRETPMEELAKDTDLILNFCLIEWDFRIKLIQPKNRHNPINVVAPIA
jgi:hypothetical protein